VSDPARERLQKVLARAGFGSRREIETWISDGRILINGKPATLGDRIGKRDRISIDGKPVRLADTPPTRVLIYNKPEGQVCSRHDPEGRDTVFRHLPRIKNARWISVGRLDINTTGLLLFTTDGQLANRLMHPSSEVEREYAVRIHGPVSPKTLQALREGVQLDDGMARFESIQPRQPGEDNKWFNVIVREGRYREVRRLWESQGLTVTRLVRLRFGPVSLPRGLKKGGCRELEGKQLDRLLEASGS
jgi:23S rRNA pseudouridine2605 synthase